MMYEEERQAELERQAKERELERENELEDLRFILSTEKGRRFLWQILERAGVFRNSYTGDNSTFFNEGRRNLGLWLIGEIAAADEMGLIQMMTEHNKVLANKEDKK